jgi:hypothetical protein
MMVDSPQPNLQSILKGHSFSSKIQYAEMTTQDFYDSIAISNVATLYTLPHEFALTMADENDDRNKPQLLSFLGTTDIQNSNTANVLDTKRISQAEQTTILASKYKKT